MRIENVYFGFKKFLLITEVLKNILDNQRLFEGIVELNSNFLRCVCIMAFFPSSFDVFP